MENNSKDPFISKVKGNIQSQGKNITANTSISNIPLINKNVNEILNDEELSKKIGRMETILNYYEAKLKNEFNERKILEDRIESLTTDVYHIQENLDNLTKLFTENFTKMKNNIMENVETKNNSMNKIIIESSKRINTIEDIILNNNNNNSNEILNPQKTSQNIENNVLNKSLNNSILISTNRDSSFMKQNYMIMQNNKYEILSKKINKIEKAVFKKGTCVGREEEINVGLTKIYHLEKKFEIFMENFNKDINIIKNNIKQNMDNIDNLSSGHNILNEKFDNLYKTFNDTNINFNKFNYHTTLLLNETHKKLEDYTDYFKNAKNDIQKMENDITEDNAILKQILNDKFIDYEKDLNDLKNKIDLENNEYKFKIEEKQDKFINLIKDEKDEYLKEAKKIQNNILEKYEIIQKENKNLNNDMNEMKNSFFHNLNEMEQYFNKKYQIIYKAINLQEN
jgi:hypothetical protein